MSTVSCSRDVCPRGLALLAGFVLALSALGCANQRKFQAYEAGKIPPEFLASSMDNVQTLDLSRLAAATAGSKQIGAGDLLEVAIDAGYAGQVESTTVRVADDGSGTIPLIGRLPLAGMEPDDAERMIAATAVERGLYRRATVTVDVKRTRTNRVTVIGAVANPAVYELPRGSSSLLAAIVAAGGLSSDAGAAVEIRRPQAARGLHPAQDDQVTAAGYQQPPPALQPVSYHVNLIDAAQPNHAAQTLEDGDIVMVQKRDPQPFDVIGLVHRQGRFELPPNKDLFVLDALAMASGASTPFSDIIYVIRRAPGQPEPIVIQVSIKEAKQHGQGNLRLCPGDIVSVEQTPLSMVSSLFGLAIPMGGFAAYQVLK